VRVIFRETTAGLLPKRRLRVLYRVLCALMLASAASGCAPKAPADRPMRSPSLDYPTPPAQTSDGRVLGADGKPPADTLKTGPSNEGPAPGWRSGEGTPSYDANDRVGGQTEHDSKSDVHHPHGDKEHDDETSSDEAPAEKEAQPTAPSAPTR
jgi:hypothetical protein